MWAVFAHSPSWPAACRYRWWHSYSGQRAGSWSSNITKMFGSSLGLSVSPSASCFGYSAQLGAWSEATLLALTLPSWSTTFQHNGVALQPGHSDWSTAPVSTVTWTWKVFFRGLARFLMFLLHRSSASRLKSESLSTLPTSVCSSVLVPRCLSRMTTMAFRSLKCMFYLYNYSLVLSEFLMLRSWAWVTFRFKFLQGLT